jgi:hypothetical protein
MLFPDLLDSSWDTFIESRPMVCKAREFETIKKILVEVFHARPGEVEEMIPRRRGKELARRRGDLAEGARGGAAAKGVLPG